MGHSHDARTPTLPACFLPRGLPEKVPSQVLGDRPDCPQGPTLSRESETFALYLGKPLSEALRDFPLFLVVNFIAQQKNRNIVSHSFLQNR